MVGYKHYFWIIGILLPLLSFSQKKKKPADYTFLSLPNVVVDGDLTEWEGHFYRADSKLWQCALSRDADHLYAAVVIKDPALQNEAILRGIVLNMSYNHKKKDGARLIFPLADRESLRAIRQDEDHDRKNIKQDLLHTTRGYFVRGFTKVRDGLLSLHNDYGIQAVAKIDSNQYLRYEAVIPLDLIKFKSDEIAVQLLINTQYHQLQQATKERTPNYSGMYGIYRPQGPTLRNPYSEETEIWIVDTLK